MRAMKAMKSMTMPAVRMKPAMRAMKSMKAKKKPAVRMKPAMRAMKSMNAKKGHEVNESERIDGYIGTTKDDQIVDLRVQLEGLSLKAAGVHMELKNKRAYVVAATAKIARLEEEIKNNIAIVPETGTLWEKAGDDMIAIEVKPRGPADVDSAKDTHQLEVEVSKYQTID